MSARPSVSMRLVDTDLMSARRNIAVTAALAEQHRHDRCDLLRLYLFPRAVLIGSGQRLADAVDTAACAARGIEVARRVTGGGAVYMSPGVLTWDLIAHRRRVGWDLDDISARVGHGIAAGLATFGVAARFAPPNGIAIAGRKVSGSSGSIDGTTVVLQGTVLVDADLTEMAAALKAPNGTPTVIDNVTTLARELGAAAPPLDAVKARVTERLGAALYTTFEATALTAEEHALADQLLAEGVGAIDAHEAPAIKPAATEPLIPHARTLWRPASAC